MAHLLMVEGDFERARDHALRAIRLAPSLGDAYSVSVYVHICLGLCDEALHYSREALRCTLAAPDYNLHGMAEAHLGGERFAEAAAVARRILERRPDWLMTRALLVISLMNAGRKDEARRLAAEIRATNPRFTATRWRKTLLYSDRADVPVWRRCWSKRACRTDVGRPRKPRSAPAPPASATVARPGCRP